MLEGPRPDPTALIGRPIYSTAPAPPGNDPNRPGQRRRAPWSPPEYLLPDNAWYVPVLIGKGSSVAGGRPGSRRSLTLYRVQAEPPQLTAADVAPRFAVNRSLGPLMLVGFDLPSDTVCPGGRIDLTLYWRADDLPRDLIATNLGDRPLDTHELGLGNLRRYITEMQPAPTDVVVESYTVVVPATVPDGEYPLTVSLQGQWPLRPLRA